MSIADNWLYETGGSVSEIWDCSSSDRVASWYDGGLCTGLQSMAMLEPLSLCSSTIRFKISFLKQTCRINTIQIAIIMYTYFSVFKYCIMLSTSVHSRLKSVGWVSGTEKTLSMMFRHCSYSSNAYKQTSISTVQSY